MDSHAIMIVRVELRGGYTDTWHGYLLTSHPGYLVKHNLANWCGYWSSPDNQGTGETSSEGTDSFGSVCNYCNEWAKQSSTASDTLTGDGESWVYTQYAVLYTLSSDVQHEFVLQLWT